jgi:L-histidine N-alpha-methyltransferase
MKSLAEESRPPQVSCQPVAPARAVPSLLDDARAGLLCAPRSLPPKYFYDDRGSRLFDRICDTPEYYPTRTEASLLGAHADEIMRLARPDHILEFGSGTSRKTRHLLDVQSALHYWPFDVCEPMLCEAGEALIDAYPGLRVTPLLGDYNAGLAQLPSPEGRRLFVFLGGTIGNFEHRHAHDFLAELRAHMRPGDALLLGADRIKDPARLHAAYNDAQGVTAEFNLNLLRVLNRELGADFRIEAFAHEARFEAERGRIEMYLVSLEDQRVRLPALDAHIDLGAGERILTEISRKFTMQGLEALLEEAGLAARRHFEPADGAFSLVLAEPKG